MLKINGYEANYNNLYIYEGENILFTTSRTHELTLELDGLNIRNARKINFAKGDIFEVKTSDTSKLFRNGKDLYIPSSIISVESVTEKKHFEHDGETNFKNVYVMKLHCNAHTWNTHIEKVTDLPSNMPLTDYDKNGKFGSGYSKNCNIYELHTHPKTGENWISKNWMTYDVITEITLESDYYTRTEKTAERLQREEIVKIISSCLYSGKTVSHFEVERLMEKLNISIK